VTEYIFQFRRTCHLDETFGEIQGYYTVMTFGVRVREELPRPIVNLSSTFKVYVNLPTHNSIAEIVETIIHEDLHIVLEELDVPLVVHHECTDILEKALKEEISGAIKAMISNRKEECV